jgi:hypothetical protein
MEEYENTRFATDSAFISWPRFQHGVVAVSMYKCRNTVGKGMELQQWNENE